MIFEKQVIKMYGAMAFSRCDDKGIAYYFSAADFEGLNKEPYAFKSSKGHILQGYIYSYENPISGRIVVFDHGFGGGHESYMKEIEMLCKHGFMVFAYDHTGCMKSGGENINGMAQSLCDLNDCISTLKADERFANFDFSVMGHSWGGFSTLNISALHPDISHVVVLSGFVSVKNLVSSFFSGIMKGYRKVIMEVERKSNPKFVDYDAVETLSKTDAKVLLIYSANDKLVSKTAQYDLLKNGLSHKGNIRFILEENKGHNPNYTEDAVAYLGEYSAALAEKTKKKELETDSQKAEFKASWDWNRMTAQDEKVWAEIFKTLGVK